MLLLFVIICRHFGKIAAVAIDEDDIAILAAPLLLSWGFLSLALWLLVVLIVLLLPLCLRRLFRFLSPSKRAAKRFAVAVKGGGAAPRRLLLLLLHDDNMGRFVWDFDSMMMVQYSSQDGFAFLEGGFMLCYMLCYSGSIHFRKSSNNKRERRRISWKV